METIVALSILQVVAIGLFAWAHDRRKRFASVIGVLVLIVTALLWWQEMVGEFMHTP